MFMKQICVRWCKITELLKSSTKCWHRFLACVQLPVSNETIVTVVIFSYCYNDTYMICILAQVIHAPIFSAVLNRRHFNLEDRHVLTLQEVPQQGIFWPMSNEHVSTWTASVYTIYATMLPAVIKMTWPWLNDGQIDIKYGWFQGRNTISCKITPSIIVITLKTSSIYVSTHNLAKFSYFLE